MNVSNHELQITDWCMEYAPIGIHVTNIGARVAPQRCPILHISEHFLTYLGRDVQPLVFKRVHTLGYTSAGACRHTRTIKPPPFLPGTVSCRNRLHTPAHSVQPAHHPTQPQYIHCHGFVWRLHPVLMPSYF